MTSQSPVINLALAAAAMPHADVDGLIELLITIQDARTPDPEAEADDDGEPDADESRILRLRDPSSIRVVMNEIAIGHDDDAEPEDAEGCDAGEDLGTIALDDFKTRRLVQAARRDTRRLVEDIRWRKRA